VNVAGTLALVTAAAAGCSRTGSEGEAAQLISRDRFVAAYVELRLAALRDPRGEIDATERDRILSELDLTADDLLRFADRHGTNPELMSAVWDSVEVEIQKRHSSLDAPHPDEPPLQPPVTRPSA